MEETLADHLIRHWHYLEMRQAGSHLLLRTGESVRSDTAHTGS